MTSHNFYDLDATDPIYSKQPEATPGDGAKLMLRRGIVNTVKQNLANAVIGNAFPIYNGETVFDMWYRVITAEDTSNAKIDCGFAGGTEIASDGAVATANATVANGNFLPIYFAANNAATIMPGNAVTIDAGVFEVCALILKSYDEGGAQVEHP